MSLIPRYGRIYFARPGIDAAAQRLSVFEPLIAQPNSYIHRADAGMADSHNVRFRIEFLEDAGRDLPHWDVSRARNPAGCPFPRLSDIEKHEIGAFGLQQGSNFWTGGFEIKHRL